MKSKNIISAVSAAVLIGIMGFSFVCKKNQSITSQQKNLEKIAEEQIPQQSAITLKFYLDKHNSLTGTYFAITEEKRKEWEAYRPIWISIPEIDYGTPFPVKSGSKSVLSSFRPRFSHHYTYVVEGKNPDNDQPIELFRQQHPSQ